MPARPNIGSFLFVRPRDACEALSSGPTYASTSVIIRQILEVRLPREVGLPGICLHKYLPKSSSATFSAGRSKNLPFKTFLIPKNIFPILHAKRPSCNCLAEKHSYAQKEIYSARHPKPTKFSFRRPHNA